jgi:hypothetical protein
VEETWDRRVGTINEMGLSHLLLPQTKKKEKRKMKMLLILFYSFRTFSLIVATYIS